MAAGPGHEPLAPPAHAHQRTHSQPTPSPFSARPAARPAPLLPSTPQLGGNRAVDSPTELNSPISSQPREPADPFHLLRLAPTVLQSRKGSVLSRGFILKADYRPVAPPALSGSIGGKASGSRTGAGGAAGGSGGSSKAFGTGDEKLHLQGATNFRLAEHGVYGVAQPTETGLRTILSVLGSHGAKGKQKGRRTVWFSTREEPVIYIGAQPFVLRDAAYPTRTYAMSDRAENLEEIEKRLKQDIEKEALRYGNTILVQEESPSGEIQNVWVTADSVRTVRELWESVEKEGYNVSYHRVPITRDQSPEDRYLDRYVSILSKTLPDDNLVFNCGLGVVRTTFAMVAALLVRRKQLIAAGQADGLAWIEKVEMAPQGGHRAGGAQPGHHKLAKVLREKEEQSGRDKSLLTLMSILSKSMERGTPESIISLLFTHPGLLESLRKAVLGQYDIVLSLLSTLDDGVVHKHIVDTLIDRCDALVNLREVILQNRVRHASLAMLDENASKFQRGKALASLERYFFLITFSAYVRDSDIGFSVKFSRFLKQRDEIATMIGRMRKTGHFYVFSPVHDLSLIARGTAEGRWSTASEEPQALVKRAPASTILQPAEGDARTEVVGDEWGRQITQSRAGIILRAGMILKTDQWPFASSSVQPLNSLSTEDDAAGSPTLKSPTMSPVLAAASQQRSTASGGLGPVPDKNVPYLPRSLSKARHPAGIRGALNFRRIGKENVYALAQPSQEGLERVLASVIDDLEQAVAAAMQESKEGGGEGEVTVAYANLREEPLIYINGTPYVLREEAVSLRNVKSYAGISSSRLELLEDRLKSDVLAELKTFDGKILLHTETENGKVRPVWETVENIEDNVKTLREVMEDAKERFRDQVNLVYRRIPVTAERAPDFTDIKDLVEIVTQLDQRTSAIVVNCQLGRGRSARALVVIALVQRWIRGIQSSANSPFIDAPKSTRSSYSVINNLLRVLPRSQEIKNVVDEAISLCGGGVYDVLDAIEGARKSALETAGPGELRDRRASRGLSNLRSYYFLILFASWLSETKAQTWRALRETASYETYVKDRPVFKTIECELDNATLDALVPLEKPLESGMALSDEVSNFVMHRSGRILSQSTMLKSDYFSGLQKMSLPEKITGLPNFRRVRLTEAPADKSKPESFVFGTGMPTVEGLRAGMVRMNAKEQAIVWTGMREEPTVYVSSRPHVLRLADSPLTNVITTGVTAETVESMESALKEDLLREAAENGGRVLLHDEVEEADGSFTITACWEKIEPSDILTPKDVWGLMAKEGFKVDYERLPVTDEQAPIPNVYNRIEERVVAALHKYGEGGCSFVSNCQMGRGRTTTGQVATWLVYNILLYPPSFSAGDMASSFIELAEEPAGQLMRLGGWGDDREVVPYLQGEYKVILQLVGVLKHGKMAKKLTDRAVDAMEGVQNLRKAVWDLKLRYEAADAGSKKAHTLFEAAINYLYRYATLVTFAAYLLEKAEATAADASPGGLLEPPTTPLTPVKALAFPRAFPPFPAWLKRHNEIGRILMRKSLE